MSNHSDRLSQAMAGASSHLDRYLTSEESPPERLHAAAAMMGAIGTRFLGVTESVQPPDMDLVETIEGLVESGPATVGVLLICMAGRLFGIADQLADQDIAARTRGLILLDREGERRDTDRR